MLIHIEATYENGVLRPSEPLDLPNLTAVHVTVVPRQSTNSEEDLLPERPPLSVDDFHKILNQGIIRAGTLPVDFDRDDIYSDHD